jgi:calcineurin-like phosphoesterase family protein
MNDYITDEINRLCDDDSLLVLLGDTLMIDKNYNSFISKLQCNLIMLYGNHCNRNRFNEVTGECSNRLLYHGDYCELAVDKQIFCCSHYPMMHWNYQDEGSISLHGHTHAFESDILGQIHKYKSLDVGIDSFYQKYGVYSIFSHSNIVAYLNSNKTADRH